MNSSKDNGGINKGTITQVRLTIITRLCGYQTRDLLTLYSDLRLRIIGLVIMTCTLLSDPRYQISKAITYTSATSGLTIALRNGLQRKI